MCIGFRNLNKLGRYVVHRLSDLEILDLTNLKEKKKPHLQNPACILTPEMNYDV